MKRATLIILFLAALFVACISMLFRGCDRPARTLPAARAVSEFHAPITPVPEPSTYALWGVCALTLIVLTRKR